MSFSDDLTKFQKSVLDKYIRVKRQSAFDLFSAIVFETPVDKGVLRNNWFAGIKNPSSRRDDDADPSGGSTVLRINKILKGTDLASDVFLTNNLPYASPIEFDGISGKAPQGMVRVNTARWDSIVAVNVRSVNRGK